MQKAIFLIFLIFLVSIKNFEVFDISPTADPPTGLTMKGGYIPISATSESQIYFTFYSKKNNPPTKLFIQLGGGPGISTIASKDLFENGVFRVNDDAEVIIRDTNLLDSANMLYIDQPVGTGFSFLKQDSDLPTTCDAAAQQFYYIFNQFINNPNFSTYKTNDVYFLADGYGAKFATCFSKYIIEQNKAATTKIALKGLILGNAFIDPLTIYKQQLDHRTSFGLINNLKKQKIQEATEKLINSCKNHDTTCQQYIQELQTDELLGGTSVWNTESFLTSKLITNVDACLKSTTVSSRYHAKPTISFEMISEKVYKAFTTEYTDSQIANLQYLLTQTDSELQILFYSGVNSNIINSPAIQTTLDSLQWAKSKDFSESQFQLWLSSSLDAIGQVKGAKTTTNNSLDFLSVFNQGYYFDNTVVFKQMIVDYLNGNLVVGQ